MILMIDNYDSFTYNLVQYIGKTGADIKVFRNDKIDVETIREMKPSKIVLSPGPGHPDESGICTDIVTKLGEEIPILGVCLGHQVIGMVYGGKIERAESLFHGKTSKIIHDSKRIYTGLKNPLVATRYHSLVLSRENFPDDVIVSSETEDGVIMGIRHKKHPVEGVQFHPESVLTEEGEKLIINFLMGC